MYRFSQLQEQLTQNEQTQAIQKWWNSDRFRNCYRPYTAQQVSLLKDTHQEVHYSNYMSIKLYKLLCQLKKDKSFSFSMGAMDTVQVINFSKYSTTIYLSGWQCSSTASNEPGPDYADYPSDTVPKKCDQLTRMQRLQDRRRKLEGKDTDYLTPIICDADAGFGGTSSVMKLIKLLIESGAAGIHIEDQRADLKKCGHMSGKVLTSTSAHMKKLIACRLQADLMGSELLIIARTDALDAKYIETDYDVIDQPFVIGKVDGVNLTYPEAGKYLLQKLGRLELINQWMNGCMGGIKSARLLAKKLGFELDWEPNRNQDGFYEIKGSVQYCAIRGKQYLKVADALWMETSKPNLQEAKELSDSLQWELSNNKFLCYNCSPSFNWRSFSFSDDDLLNFNKKLGEMGFTWQFITLAGFHLTALASEKLSKDIKERSMLAYVETIQKQEEIHKVDQLKHQLWSGTELLDYLGQMVSPDSLVSQGKEDCQRFLPRERAEEHSFEDAMVYIKLRNHGLQKQKARDFVKQQHCKIDSTQKKHGPPGYKIFHTKVDQFKLIKGYIRWQMVGKLKYEEIEQDKFQQARNPLGLLLEHKKDEQLRLQQLKDFYNEMENKYKLTEISKDSMIEKLRSLSNDTNYKNRVPQYMMKFKNQVYYELADYFMEQPFLEQDSLVQQMEAFEDLLPQKQRSRLKIEPKIIEKFPSAMPEQVFQRRSRILKELSLTYRGKLTIKEPSEDVQKQARKTFKQDFNESNYVSKLQEFPSASVISSVQDFDENTPKKRFSILTPRDSYRLKGIQELTQQESFKAKLQTALKNRFINNSSLSPIQKILKTQ
ncbi:hypothetical protein pb186bvf_011147 [Paramecium bursaria]